MKNNVIISGRNLERDYNIAMDILNNISVSELAKKHNLHISRIRQIGFVILRKAMRYYKQELTNGWHLKINREKYRDYLEGFIYQLRNQGINV